MAGRSDTAIVRGKGFLPKAGFSPAGPWREAAGGWMGCGHRRKLAYGRGMRPTHIWSPGGTPEPAGSFPRFLSKHSDR